MKSTLVSDSVELRRRSWSKLKSLGTVLLATSDARGCLRSRPLAVQQANCSGVLWFFVTRSSDVAADVERDPRVNASCMDIDSGFYLSASGTARVVEDKTIAREVWSYASKAWFPGGVDDPELTLLKVVVDHAEVWNRDSNRMIRFHPVATAALLGASPAGADAREALRV